MKKNIVTSILIIGSACAVLAFGACSPKSSLRATDVVVVAAISGAVSGISGKVAEQYATQKSNIHGDYFFTSEPVAAWSFKYNRMQQIPAGQYLIKVRGRHPENDLPYIVVEGSDNEAFALFIK